MKNGPSKEFLEERLALTEAELQRTEIQADTALKYAEQVWWSWNLSSKRLKIRSVDECILGYGESDMDNSEDFWWDRIHPEDMAEVRASLGDCFAAKVEVWRCEHRLRDVSGDWVWVEQSGFVLYRDGDGNPKEMVGTTRKVQERYQLLDLFRGSESVIEAMLAKAPVYFWIRDPKGAVLLASHHLLAACGQPVKELTPAAVCLPGELLSWQTAFDSALQGNAVQRRISLSLEKAEPQTHDHHLIPLPMDSTPFGVLEFFLPEPA